MLPNTILFSVIAYVTLPVILTGFSYTDLGYFCFAFFFFLSSSSAVNIEYMHALFFIIECNFNESLWCVHPGQKLSTHQAACSFPH